MKTTKRTRKEIRKRLDNRHSNSPIAFEDEIANLLDDADRAEELERELEQTRQERDTAQGQARDNDAGYCIMRDALETTRAEVSRLAAENRAMARALEQFKWVAECVVHAGCEGVGKCTWGDDEEDQGRCRDGRVALAALAAAKGETP